MSFKQITGNDELVERLRNIAGSGHIHNGYIFEGPWTANKKLVAESFAKAILCPVQPGEGCDSCRICKMIDDGNHIDVMGPLLARKGEAVIPLPGGCAIGDRPVELHFKGLRALGADIRVSITGIVKAKAEKLKGADIYLDFPSVGATENIMSK